jgi:spermidine synthase
MMAIQTILNRIAALSIGASQFTFSIVVAVFVLCIALGSFAVSALRRIPIGTAVVTQWILVLLLVALYLQVSSAPYWAHVVRTWFGTQPNEFLRYQLALAALILLVLAIPIGLSGALLPLLFHALRREIDDLGAMAGRLYGANTVGSLLGSLVGGYLLLYWLDLHQVARIALFSLSVAAFLLSARLLPGRWTLVSGIALALTIVVLLALPPWSQHNLTSGAFRLRVASDATRAGPAAFFKQMRALGNLLYYRDDPTVTISVRETTAGSRGLFTNGKPDTLIPTELRTVVLLGVLPCLFAEQCQSAFVIGLGTGATAGALGNLDAMQRVVVAEISPGVEAALPLFASKHNGDPGRNPRIEVRRGDAYRTLLRDGSRYDVIVSAPSNPWVTGVENLYSREFLLAAKQRLNPGGVYAQWFHLYESSRGALELVLRTYASVFDAVAVWAGGPTDLILLGWDGAERALDVVRIEARMKQPDYATRLQSIQLEAPLALLAHELLPLGVVQTALGPGETLRLMHPILSYQAGIDFFVGKNAELPGTAPLETAQIATRNSLVRRYTELHGGSLSDEERRDLVFSSCSESASSCATLMGWWAAENPSSLLRQGTAHFPIDPKLVTVDRTSCSSSTIRATAGPRPDRLPPPRR